ncbi:MAG: adenine deaminase [Terriglobia bacterium]|nr:MAG: adenine deaminase [Terriglobia bacterium]
MDGTNDGDIRSRAIAAAQGHAPFDVLILNGVLIDVATSELREADIGITGSLVASVHPRGARTDAAQCYDFSGCYIAPGFIDTHVHFESSHMTPENYASVVVPQGTTTILYDPHELANVLGLEGVRYAIETGRNLPLRMIGLAPSCVPSAPGLEMSGADFRKAEVQEMLSWPEIAGLAEVMDMNGILRQNGRTMEILRAGLESGKLVEGHARGLSGPGLQAYAAAGITSDHEITSAEDGLEKLRAGMTLEVRGSHDYVLPGLVQAINRLPQVPSGVTVCTDDVPPDYLVEHGGICDVLRRLVKYGMDPVQAIRCATLHASYRMRRPDLGLVAPGRTADLVVLSDLSRIAVESVFASGRLAARAGKLVEAVAPPKTRPPQSKAALAPLSRNDCRVPVPERAPGRVTLRVIKGARFTSWSEVEVDVEDGYAILPEGFGVMLVRHRHGRRPAEVRRAVIEDWGELRGAIATTYSHDAHNLVVLGRSPDDMRVAANEVIAAGGGIAVVRDGQVIASVSLPVAGILSAEEPEQLARSYRLLRSAADQVVDWEPPYRVFKAIAGTALACNAGPHLTDLGLTDGTTGEIVGILAGDTGQTA